MNRRFSLKPFFTYFGGKYRAAMRYPIPGYTKLIEPFAGSAGYSLRYPHKEVVLYDINEKVFGTWDYLIKVTEAEINALPLVVEDVRTLNLPQEAKWLIGWWLNKGGAGPCNVPGAWMREGTHVDSFWGASVRHRIASQIQYIRHWKVHQASYETVPNCLACWYIDPPYHRSGKDYVKNEIDYEHLAAWCRSRNGQVIVCEQEGADWLPFKSYIDLKSLEGCKGKSVSKEVIWSNVDQMFQSQSVKE